ncbi:MAG: hypothetical protein K5865_06750 [Eubacterium sp.]|nr:hypothetical protein [Eubacterium sp.]
MTESKGLLKKIIAVFMAVIFAVSLVPFNSGKGVEALDVTMKTEIDISGKRCRMYLSPYTGSLRVCSSEKVTVYPYSDNSKVAIYAQGELLREDGVKMGDKPNLYEGDKYTYHLNFVSISTDSSKKAYDITDFSFELIDAETFEVLPLKGVKRTISDDRIYYEYEYEFEPKQMPVKYKGDVSFDLTEGDYVADSEIVEPSFIFYILAAIDVDKSIIDTGHGLDIDKDGTEDVSVITGKTTPFKLRKAPECSVKGRVTIELSQDARNFLKGISILNHGVYQYNSITFILDKYDISKAEISGIVDKEYTGAEIKQSPVLKFDGVTLVEGTDYSVSYSGNKEPGTATVTFTGKGDYAGTVSRDFKITKAASDQDNKDDIPEIKGTVHGDLENGLWVEREDGTYPVSQWGKVGGKTYYFDKRGYAAANEYAGGKWFNADGSINESFSMVWKSNEKGWWIEDVSGWYPVSRWLRIDGYWYYFTESGYMDYSEYRDGCWLGADGAWDETYSGGHWMSDSTGWWYEDNGWYPSNQYLWIDGTKYWFNADGYWE